jgi:peptidoglycan hydrolase-like protein with peptidoglycan-binding domain
VTSAPASVARVQQAEEQFAATRKGISDTTPLAQAAEQFNSAAVALEMAWLQLFADAHCLDGAQQEQAAAAVSSYTSALQEQLAQAGYYDDDVDGVYGPATVAAVDALQKAHGLRQTGTVDKATQQALESELAAKGGAAAQKATVSTAALQQTLKLTGHWTGPVDGQWTDELTDALRAFQKDLGVEETGTVDAATVAAFEKALAKAQAPPPTPTSSPRPTFSSVPPTVPPAPAPAESPSS